MSVRLQNSGTVLDAFRYSDVAWYFAVFHDITGQNPSCVLTKQEYIARAVAAYDKIGRGRDDGRYVVGETEAGDEILREPSQALIDVAFIKIGDVRRRLDGGQNILHAGHVEMFTWADYAEEGEIVDFA